MADVIYNHFVCFAEKESMLKVYEDLKNEEWVQGLKINNKKRAYFFIDLTTKDYEQLDNLLKLSKEHPEVEFHSLLENDQYFTSAYYYVVFRGESITVNNELAGIAYFKQEVKKDGFNQ